MTTAPHLLSAARLEDAAIWRLTGKDRLTWLHNFCTADVRGLAPGEGREAFVLNVKGRTLAHLLVLAGESDVLLVALHRPGVSLAEHFDRYIIREDVQVRDITPHTSVWWTNEPGDWIPAADREVLASWSHIPLPHMPTVRAVATKITADRDWLIISRADESEEAPPEVPGLDSIPAAAEALERGRILRAWPMNGAEVTEASFPQEFRRDRQAISFNKGCYLGQETVARIDALGHVNQFLVRVDVEGTAEGLAGVELKLPEGKVVGRITSAASTGPDSAVALAMVRAAQIHDGATWSTGSGMARAITP